jgi:hypothetical protein
MEVDKLCRPCFECFGEVAHSGLFCVEIVEPASDLSCLLLDVIALSALLC